MPKVLKALASCQEREKWLVWLGADNVTLPSEITSLANRVFEYKNKDCDYTVLSLLLEAFKAGAEQFMYLADDCVPSADYLRCAATVAMNRDCAAYGLWWPSHQGCMKYPEILCSSYGRVCPSKAFGIRPDLWMNFYWLALEFRESRLGTYDCAFAHWIRAHDYKVIFPALSRVRDISEFGTFDNEEALKKFRAIPSCSENYTGEYVRIL